MIDYYVIDVMQHQNIWKLAAMLTELNVPLSAKVSSEFDKELNKQVGIVEYSKNIKSGHITLESQEHLTQFLMKFDGQEQHNLGPEVLQIYSDILAHRCIEAFQ